MSSGDFRIAWHGVGDMDDCVHSASKPTACSLALMALLVGDGELGKIRKEGLKWGSGEVARGQPRLKQSEQTSSTVHRWQLLTRQ